ncbi:uncharacterized protein DUF4065 [Zymomonas mobilis]|uniref:Uncharacterized protein DUF4065 n=1 Tax=Zymomonas mobilis TaxID=542 RepID=A0A542VUD6_ZYMMB|nr:Panacea domain-containing protein [Zymomonas mobilis]TQL14929.1 uncharacterized protein DUF4065 [Zymomonas mobilis]
MAPDRKKILEVILFLLEEGERRGLMLTQYDIVKSVFLADKKHLDEFGRPITFDNYTAMKHGPVPSFTYDLLKPTAPKSLWQFFGLDEPPWIRKERAGTTAAEYSCPERHANLRKLSATDIDALCSALTVVKSLRFGDLREYTHSNRAYIAAWRDDDAVRAFDMDYRLIPDVDDLDLIDDLAYASHHCD